MAQISTLWVAKDLNLGRRWPAIVVVVLICREQQLNPSVAKSFTKAELTHLPLRVPGRLSMTSPPLLDLQVLSKLLLPPWERVLWQAQPYEDNYTDRTFLQSLITNENFSEYDFWRIVRDSVVVAQHLSATVIFLAMFYLTNYCYVQLRWMLFVDVLLGAAGCAAMILTTMYKVRASPIFREYCCVKVLDGPFPEDSTVPRGNACPSCVVGS